MKILVLNGPNINILGKRNKEDYGSITYQQLVDEVSTYAQEKQIDLTFQQSNHEGVLIDILQSSDDVYDAVIFNAAGYTHTSVALMDTILAIVIPVIEVHLSKVKQREDFRKISFIEKACVHSIYGYGIKSYTMAIDFLIKN